IKDNLFELPPIFKIIQENSGADYKEMYQVFNMGHRLEIFTNESTAAALIAIAAELGIEAQVVGRVEASQNGKSSLTLKGGFGEVFYQY
ncbi:AIR synthase-related protein, partial [Sediminibacterium sp.]|uniref:AIR synthase-related protein n=1 Tax=Sediminibacterium sp. TaxID=1917865 RepID=UPI003F6A118D